MIEPTPIPGFDDYGATRDGFIWSRKSGEWRALALCHKGSMRVKRGKSDDYLKVKLYTSPGCYKQIAVQILIALTFIGPKPSPTHTVNHENGEVENNAVWNLSWMTMKEQSAHARRTGLWITQKSRFTPEEWREHRRELERVCHRRYRATHPGPERCRGERMVNHKLSEADVIRMRALASTHSLSRLGSLFGISKNTAWRIVRGMKWSHV